MIRPRLGVVSCLFGLVAIVLEALVFVLYFTFLGLELCGLLTGILGVCHGFCGIMTAKNDAAFPTRQNLYLLDQIVSVLFALAAFGMLCGSLLAVSIYVYVVMLIGMTPGIYELMAFFGIPATPFLSLIVLKALVMIVYFILWILAVTAAISNRRNRPEADTV